MSLQAPMRAIAAKSCPVCRAQGTVRYERLIDKASIVAGEWRGMACANTECGTYWLDPVPIVEDIHKAYAIYYTHGCKPGGNNEVSNADRRILRVVGSIERWWLKLLFLGAERDAIESMYLANLPAGNVLDVGCGDGRLLDRFRKLGWKAEGQDVDPNAVSVRSEDTVVHLGELIALQLPSNHYDAVVMNHVIEHVHQPVEVLSECRRILKPNGLMVITAPNPESYGHRLFGNSWAGLDPPRHLHLFTPRALGDIISKAGWANAEIFTTPARAGGMLATSRDIKRQGFHKMGGRKSLTHMVFAAWYQFIARVNHIRSAGTGEEVVLIARK